MLSKSLIQFSVNGSCCVPSLLFNLRQKYQFSSVAQLCPALCDPHGLQHAKLPYPSPTLRACSNSCLSSRWWHPTISSSVIPFFSCFQPFPASGSFLMSQFFPSSCQSIGVSASPSVLPMNIQNWFILGLTGLISLRANYGGSNEDNGNLLQKVPGTHCFTLCPRPCSRPPLTHASAGESWTLTGKYESVTCGVTVPFSWVLVHTRFCLCPPKVCFPSPV